MKIKAIALEPLNILFNEVFTHASKSRNSTEAVVAVATSHNGKIGYGEGCPRDYVTGESIDSARAFFLKFTNELKSISSIEDLVGFENKFRAEIDKNPAAFCSIELAILDLLGKSESLRVEQLFGINESTSLFKYTAVLGISKDFQKLAEKYGKLGFKTFKVKLSGDVEIDKQNIAFLRSRFSNTCKIRADANNLWNNSGEVINYLNKLELSIEGLEEPLKSCDFSGMEEIIRATRCRIILDESFKVFGDFDKIDGSGNWLVNLRVSKMGGLIRSLHIVDEALKRGVPVIVGAQVGETSILTRAALVVARALGNNLFAQEGAFGTYLLKKDLTSTPLQFGLGGVLDLSKFPGTEEPGFGLNIAL